MMNGSKSGLKACNVIRLSHTNTKDLIIKAGYCTNHCNGVDCTVSTKHFLTGNANANGAVATNSTLMPNQVFICTKRPVFTGKSH